MSFSEKGIIIRRTQESDLRGIFLAVSAAPEFNLNPLTAENLAEIFTSGNSVMYSAVRKKHLLGFITGRITGDKAVIEAAYVKDKFRGIGIGTSLLESFIKSSKKSGGKSFLIAITGDNQKAITFFSSRGFIHTGGIINLEKKDI